MRERAASPVQAPFTVLPLFLYVLCGGVLGLGASSCGVDRVIDTNSPPGDSQPPGNQPPPMSTLSITPADASISVDGKNPTTLPYRVLDRNGQDVTSQATLTVDDETIGAFSGAVLNVAAGAAGKTTVRAQVGDQNGSTSLTVRISVVVIAPGAPTNAPTQFGGPEDPSHDPSIAYPPPGALIPPNLDMLEVQFTPNGSTLFEVQFLGDAIDLRIYTPCNTVGTGCSLLPDETSWTWLATAARNTTVTLTVRSSVSGGTAIGTSPSQSLSFANDDMQGGLYYWAASAGGIVRYDFGLRSQKAENYYGPLQAGAICVGCHAMSRDGRRIAVGMDTPGPAAMRALDVSMKTTLFNVGTLGIGYGSNYQAWSSDGKWLITTEAGGLTVRDGAAGTLIGQNPGLANANMPDVSPDNTMVVFSRNATPQCIAGLCETLSNDGASLFTVAWNSDQTFGTPVSLVPANGKNNYYPSFSPDGRFVVYNQAGGDSYDAPDAQVMIVPSGGGTPLNLSSVNTPIGNSWPKWSPFIHRFQGSTILWLTFSSRRPYGVYTTMNSQIWMVPVDLSKLESGKDSGYPPFRLPFQDLNTGNHIPGWVEKVVRTPCTGTDSSGCDAGEQCVGDFCVPIIG